MLKKDTTLDEEMSAFETFSSDVFLQKLGPI